MPNNYFYSITLIFTCQEFLTNYFNLYVLGLGFELYFFPKPPKKPLPKPNINANSFILLTTYNNNLFFKNTLSELR